MERFSISFVRMILAEFIAMEPGASFVGFIDIRCTASWRVGRIPCVAISDRRLNPMRTIGYAVVAFPCRALAKFLFAVRKLMDNQKGKMA